MAAVLVEGNRLCAALGVVAAAFFGAWGVGLIYNPNDTEAIAAGRRGVRVRSANGTCENQGTIVAKSLTKSEA